jgi:hypothetical protein
LKPFSDGARVDIATAQIDRLEMRINDTFLITLFQIMNGITVWMNLFKFTSVRESCILLTGLSNVTSYSSSTPYGKGGNTPQIDRLEMRINDTFLITLFQIMVDNPRMTATEVMEKAQEKSMLLTPQ